jgi:hypothetical protein
MLIVTAVMLLGLLGGITASQLRGLRLGGVIIVPLFAIYTLRSFGTFPVLMLSVLGGYLSLWVVKRRLFLYGRPLFVLAVATSAGVPLLVYLLIQLGLGPSGVIQELGFIGSVLPGIAVYNFHRLSNEDRLVDALWSMALLLFLVVVGIGLVLLVGLTALRTVTPPVLLGPESDIARAFGLVVDRGAHPTLLPFPTEFGMLGLGLFASEAIRRRWGLRTGGVIVVPLLVLFAFRSDWLLAVYLVAALAAYVGVQLVHAWTLLYGRVLLSLGVIFGLLSVLALVPVLPARNGLLPFFTGILGGVGAYNLHVVAPAERRATVLLTAGVFVGLAAVGRVFVTPLPGGLLAEVTRAHYVAGGLIAAAAAVTAVRLEALRPRLDDRPPTARAPTDKPPTDRSATDHPQPAPDPEDEPR